MTNKIYKLRGLKITTYTLICICEFECVGIFDGKIVSFNSVVFKLWFDDLKINSGN